MSSCVEVDAFGVVIVGFVSAPYYNLHIAVHFVVADIALDSNPDIVDFVVVVGSALESNQSIVVVVVVGIALHSLSDIVVDFVESDVVVGIVLDSNPDFVVVVGIVFD